MIKKLELLQFKKHANWSCNLDSKIILFHGQNGSGKTSILEAINLAMPGKSLFGNNIEELIQHNKDAFEIKITADSKLSILFMQGKKIIKIQENHKKPLEVLQYFRISGLNPYIALAFWKENTIKRKYIDRIIMQQEPIFPSIYLEYLKNIKKRNQLIESSQFNSHWANALDPIIKDYGLQLTKIRKKTLDKLTNDLSHELKNFLQGDLHISFSPTLEEQEKIFSKKLDFSFTGPHLTKFFLGTKNGTKNEENNFYDKLASTGQQKKLLLTLTLAALPNNDDTENILLLDDIFANLDNETIQNLINLLSTQNFQTFVTNINKIENNLIEQHQL